MPPVECGGLVSAVHEDVRVERTHERAAAANFKARAH